jgi:hypothetical protein
MKTISGYIIKRNGLLTKEFILITDKKKTIYMPEGMELTKKLEKRLRKEIRKGGDKNGKHKRKTT